MPLWMAAVYTNGLNEEPACRCASRARSNFDCSKFRPPIRARTYPVSGSSAMKAPWR